MKFLPKIELEFETSLGQKIKLNVTLILMEEAA